MKQELKNAIKEIERFKKAGVRMRAEGYCEECDCWCLCHPCRHTKK